MIEVLNTNHTIGLSTVHVLNNRYRVLQVAWPNNFLLAYAHSMFLYTNCTENALCACISKKSLIKQPAKPCNAIAAHDNMRSMPNQKLSSLNSSWYTGKSWLLVLTDLDRNISASLLHARGNRTFTRKALQVACSRYRCSEISVYSISTSHFHFCLVYARSLKTAVKYLNNVLTHCVIS